MTVNIVKERQLDNPMSPMKYSCPEFSMKSNHASGSNYEFARNIRDRRKC